MKNENYSIQKGNPEDAEWIAGFQIKMARESENLELDWNTVLQGVQTLFDQPFRGFYVTAKDKNDNPIGCLMIQKEWSDWRNTDVWWMHSVFVIPEWRNKGVFQKMFNYVESLARQEGIAGIRLYVDHSNTRAKNIYQKLGMHGEHYALFEKMF